MKRNFDNKLTDVKKAKQARRTNVIVDRLKQFFAELQRKKAVSVETSAFDSAVYYTGRRQRQIVFLLNIVQE